MKVKSLLTLFALTTLLVSIPGSYSGISVYAQDSVDDSPKDQPNKTDREKIKEKLEEERQKLKEFREDHKAKLNEKKKQFEDYKKDLREKYNELKQEYKEKYKQLRISSISTSVDSETAVSSSSESDNKKYQMKIKREELKLLKQEFREHIKSLKLEAREHFDVLKADMKSTLEDRKNKMHDRIDALKEKYKQKIIERDYSDSKNIDGYPPEFLDKKITICHIPPGNADNEKTISISVNALRAHLAHGDHIDECEDESDEDSNDETEGEFELKVRAETFGDQSEVRVELTFLTKTMDQDMIIDEIIENFALSSEEADAALKIENDNDGLEEKFEIEIETGDDNTEVEVEIRFILDTTERDLIIDAIVERTQLTAEQIEGILVEESAEADTDDNDEEEGQEIKVELKEELGLEQSN